MASVTYNGVSLPYCYVSQFSHRVLYDEVGNTDWYCTEFDIQVQCVVHYYYLSLLIDSWNKNPPTNTDPASIMYFIRQKLLKPRQQLSIKVNGVELIPNYQNKGPVDAQNGPKPKYCDIIQMSSSSFLVSFSIVARYWENIPSSTTTNFSTSNAKGSPVLYNRWGESVDVDDCNYSVKTRTGKFLIRTDNPDGFIADQLRSQFAAVAIPEGFTRQSSKYTVDPSGLGIEYTVTDKEVYKKPIEGSFKSSGYYAETSTKMGAFRLGEAHLMLEGSKSVNQAFLAAKAIYVCMSKIGARGKQLAQANVNNPNSIRYVESASLRMDLFENKVEAIVRAWINPGPTRVGGIWAFVGMNDITPDSFANYTPAYTIGGTANYLLQAAAYYDPSLKNSALIGSTVNNPGNNSLIPVGVATQNRGVQIGQAGKLGE